MFIYARLGQYLEIDSGLRIKNKVFDVKISKYSKRHVKRVES